MPYARKYTPKEVQDILNACEGNANGGNPNAAHTLGQHLYITKNGMQSRIVDEVKEAATRFSSEEDLVGAAYEALNSATGFAELSKLDAGATKRVKITHNLVGAYEADVEYGEIWVPPGGYGATDESMANIKKMRNALSTGGSIGGATQKRALRVTLIVDENILGTPWIQTCYPEVD
jgi:hypothetical protein